MSVSSATGGADDETCAPGWDSVGSLKMDGSSSDAPTVGADWNALTFVFIALWT